MGSTARDVRIFPGGIDGVLRVPRHAKGLVIFAHGTGSSRTSPRNVAVAMALDEHGYATLLLDLLTTSEATKHGQVFDVALLALRLEHAIRWAAREPVTRDLRVGLFGASTGAAAALVAASNLTHRVAAVVSRGGRPDLAGPSLEEVAAPTLLVVGSEDHGVLALNERALARLHGPKDVAIVPRATHLFPEPGAMNHVVAHAIAWFDRYLAAQASSVTSPSLPQGAS